MGRLRLYLITALAFLLEVLDLALVSRGRGSAQGASPAGVSGGGGAGPGPGGGMWIFGGILCYLAGATPWQMALLALLGGLSGVIFHKASSFWGKWLTCLAALAGLEVLLVLGHCLAGASVFAGLRIAGPELLLSAACFPWLCS